MSEMSLSEFADKVSGMMPEFMRELYRKDPCDLHKMRITLPQLAIMIILERGGSQNMTDLARTMNVTTAAMTGIVERLVREGYVKRERDPEDRRIIKVIATTKGINAARGAEQSKKKMLARVFGVISAKERAEYLRILTIVRDRLREKRADEEKKGKE
ncbi:MAG: MarR family transcriptional regulator [Candidatus Omnitrophica bacterium]|nr:MarR family transcriptional regulator [Candidatus Omnitrophota bacterium]